MGSITTRTYRGGVDTVAGADLDEVSDLLERDGTTVWIDINGPDPDDLDRLATELGLHRLAIEDALEEHQRDKLVHYDDHVFLVCHAVTLDVDSAELTTTELDAFVGDRWMVTVREGGSDVMSKIVRRWDRTRDLASGGVGSMLYGLLDVVADGYFVALEGFEDFYDATADRIFADEPIAAADHRQWFEMRRALNRFDRIVTPLADGMASLVARDLDRFHEPARAYLSDVEAELRRAAAEVDALRELVGQIAEVNVSLRDFRQNQIVKRVTGWAAIVAVPTLITGYYGMNVPYPGSGEPWGVVAATALSLGASGWLYARFKRRDWI